MRRDVSIILFGTTLSVVPSLLFGADPPSFQGIGKLPGSRFGSFARAISDDGTAVTGNSDQADIGGSSSMAFRWQNGVMVPLGDLPGGSNSSESGGISADGSAAAGMSFSSNGTEAFRWVNGTMTGLGDLPGGTFYSHAFDVSGDGSAVVGLSRTEVTDYPFRWKAGVMINLSEGFPGTPPGGIATAASHDGEVVVGLALGRPFRWDRGVMELFELPPDALFGAAAAVSPDGSIVVGYFRIGSSNQPFIWEGGVMTLLNNSRGSALQGSAEDVSADGSVVVGSITSGPSAAFLWRVNDEARTLHEILQVDFNIDLTGWNLYDANGVSADGLTIAGSGVNPLGKPEAWIAHIGCARSGDANHDGELDEADIDGFVRCLVEGLGCGCGDFNGDRVVDAVDLHSFIEQVVDLL